MKRLLLVRGLPGSGKSSLARMFFPEADYHVVEQDMFCYENGVYVWKAEEVVNNSHRCLALTQKHLEEGNNVAVCNTFVKEAHLRPYLELAERYGYKVAVITVNNYHGGENTHQVPQPIIDRMAQEFEHRLI